MYNYFVMERLGRQHVEEAHRQADRTRLAKAAEAISERKQAWYEDMGKVMPDAAGAREVPSL